MVPPAQPAGAAWFNGAFLPPGEVRVSAFDAGFLQGDGLFETLRTYGGRPRLLGPHLRRLEAGARALGIPLPGGLDAIAREVTSRSGLAECTLRLTVTRGVVGEDAPTVLVTALPLRTWPARVYAEGARAGWLWARGDGGPPGPGVKSTSYQWAALGRREAEQRGWDEGLFLDAAGVHVTEGTATSVLAVVDGTLWSPPAEVALPGVTRAEVLRLARAQGVAVGEAYLPRAVVQRAEEVLLTGSLAEVVPVTRLEGQPVGRGVPGEVAQRLRAAYLEEAGRE
ncbi:MAG: aminotransferase class IV [Deltaproteobacteria bacterium]|nr:aminotransferase class IV [Deltaproteobacteria bacterium]